jgi:hypothetical protein
VRGRKIIVRWEVGSEWIWSYKSQPMTMTSIVVKGLQAPAAVRSYYYYSNRHRYQPCATKPKRDHLANGNKTPSACQHTNLMKKHGPSTQSPTYALAVVAPGKLLGPPNVARLPSRLPASNSGFADLLCPSLPQGTTIQASPPQTPRSNCLYLRHAYTHAGYPRWRSPCTRGGHDKRGHGAGNPSPNRLDGLIAPPREDHRRRES